jgi:hypothetical protein
MAIPLLIDPRIRDNVMLPMVLLMFLVNYIRFCMTKILNAQSNSLLDKASISYKTLRGTMLEIKADTGKERSGEDEVDLNKCLEKIKGDVKHQSAVTRSAKIRKASNFMPENSVKQRKAYFCTAETGVFSQKVVHNPMGAMMNNPDMMSGMIKQNV